jgi:hypothetical protein
MLGRGLLAQRRGRYVTGCAAHPARMAPDLALALIRDYTQPGDLVFDPLAGTGTTLVEAVRAGRNGLGLEWEAGWVALTRANIALAGRRGGEGRARVVPGDATCLPHQIPRELHGQVSLVLTSPPRSKTMPARAANLPTTITGGLHTRHGGVTPLAHPRRVGLVTGLTRVLAGCVPLLKSGGVIAVVARVCYRDGLLIDAPWQVIDAGLRAGLALVDYRRATHDGVLIAGYHDQPRTPPHARSDGVINAAPADDIAVFQCLSDDVAGGA